MIQNLLLSVLLLLTANTFSFAQQLASNDVLITLERTPCFGNCPFYKLTISADGKVKIEPQRMGRNYQTISGKTITSQISQTQLKQLVSEFERIDYFSLEKEYGSSERTAPDKNCPISWTDHPTVITSITVAGKSNQVQHYLGCKGSEILEKLTKLEYKIDEIVNTGRLMKASIDAGDNFVLPDHAIDSHWNLSPIKQKARMKDIAPELKQIERNYQKKIKIYLVYYYSREIDKRLGLQQAARAKKYLALYGIMPEKIRIADGGEADQSEIALYIIEN